MAGHSKWANIKHRKNAQDAKKSKIFLKVSKEITAAIETGKSNNPDENPRLRLAIEKAKSYNIPNENIKKILNKSEKDRKTFDEIVYEGYGPYGVAFLVECLTDNLNRTTAEVKSVFRKHNGKIGTPRSVSYLFTTKGIFVLSKSDYDFDNVFELSINLNVSDIYDENEFIIIETKPQDFLDVKIELEKHNVVNFISYEITKVSNDIIKVSTEENIQIQKMIEDFENLEDVQEVYVNIEFN